MVEEVVDGWGGCVVAPKVARAYRPNKTAAVDRMFTAAATQLNVLIMKNRSPASFHNDTGHLLIQRSAMVNIVVTHGKGVYSGTNF